MILAQRAAQVGSYDHSVFAVAGTSSVLRFEREFPDHRYSTFLRNHDQTRTMTALGDDVRKAKLAATLHLTLPGLPFVYYGEEIGMTGDKPDENLRTPMQWRASAGPGTGFTTGTPWEAPRPDWRERTVESQDGDSASLLALYRRLIRLRGTHSALGSGDLVVLDAGSDSAAAYLRRDVTGGRHVLVVANLGGAPRRSVPVSSAAAALPSGRYTVRSLLDGRVAAPLSVGADGVVRAYVPVEAVAAMAAVILELSRDR
jgi:glycosidase